MCVLVADNCFILIGLIVKYVYELYYNMYKSHKLQANFCVYFLVFIFNFLILICRAT